MADKKVLVEIEYDTDSAVNNINKLVNNINELTDEIVKNENELQALKDAYKKGTITQEQYSQAMEDTKTAIANGKKERKNLLTQLKSETGSVDKLKAQIADLTKRRNKLNQNTKEGKEQAQAYNAKLKDMKGALKEAQSGTKEAGNAFGRLRDDLQSLPGPLGGIVSGIGGMTKAALKFIATPLGAIITAIVFVVQQMIEAFKRSESRMVALKAIGARLSGVFKGFQKVLEPLVDFIFNNVIVAFEKLSTAADKAVRLVSRGLRSLGFDKAADNVDNFIDKIEATSRAAGELAEMEGKLTEELRKQERTQLEFQKRAEELRQIRDDEARLINERIKANEKLGEVLREQLDEELRIANYALATADKRIEVEGETTEALDARAEALTKIAEIEERIVGQESEQLVNINALLKERAELEKELLDFKNETYKSLTDFLDKEAEAYDFELVSEQEMQEAMTDFHNKRLEEINAEREARILAEQEIMATALESFDRIAQASGVLMDDRIAMQAQILQSAIKFNNLEEQSEREKLDTIAALETSLTNLIIAGNERELSNLEAEKEAALALVGDDAEAQEAIEKDFANREAALLEKQFNEEKTKALIDSAIQTAVAVVKTLPNIPLSLAIGAAGAAQTAIIAKQQYTPATYAEGGKLTLFGGRPHSLGGTDLFGSDGTHLKVEKDESAFVLKKNATAEIMALSRINESFGGRSFNTKSNYMQEGGQANLSGVSATDLERIISNLKIFTEVSDIKTGLSRYDKVINNRVI